ncbi:MAG: hypothetical protein EOM21_20280 [Gammaproteobacteria bacterium]|nr:hypothetical protein [Gammaproteobacteria bacterium]
MYDPIETFEVGPLTVEIHYDSDPMNPREEFDNLGVMACWHHRYRLGDEQPTCDPDEYLMSLLSEEAQNRIERCDRLIEEVPCSFGEDYRWHPAPQYAQRYARLLSIRSATIENDLEKNLVMHDLWLYDHSGIAMSAAPFSCGWDSGRVGIIYMTMEQARKEWSGTDEEIRERAENYLKGEVETYSMFLEGQVYGFTIEDEDDEVLESVWGFFGLEYAMEEARHMAEYLVEKMPQQLELAI